MTDRVAAAPFERNAFTWFAYALMFFFAISVALPGPIVPFIGDRLDLTYTQRGLHFTMIAAGNLSTGLLGDRITNWLGNRRASRAFVLIGSMGGVLFMFGAGLWATLPGSYLLGVGAGVSAMISTATLADAHPAHQSQAIAEGNISAGVGVAVAPFLVGLLEQTGLGWQGMAAIHASLALALVAAASVPFPAPRSQSEAAQASGRNNQPLPTLYWLFGMVIFMTIAIEWVIVSWTPDYLSEVRGFDRGTAAALGSGFTWAIVVGRVLGRWLLGILRPEQLLVGAYVLLLVLFPLYVYYPAISVSLGAMVLLGLVLANQFPLVVSAAMEAGEEQTNRASARISVFGGLATLILPQTVGSLADVVGLQTSFGLVIVLGVIAVSVTLYALSQRDKMALNASPTTTP